MDEDVKKATVGVIVPAYNQGKYLNEAIRSLKEQTFQDFFVHIVDDGSNDGVTPEIIRALEYDKATKFLNKDNKGVAYRMRQHFAKINAEYILILCADDKIKPTFLEETVDYMDKNKKCGAVSVNIEEYNDVFGKKPDYIFKYNKERMKFPAMLSECHCLGSSLMRKKALDDIDLSGGFIRYQDWDRWISMLEAGWELGLIEKPLFMYRQHSHSLSHSTNSNIEAETFHKIVCKHEKIYKKYSIEIMMDLQKRYWEVWDGKSWLEKQYSATIDENKKLKQQLKWTTKGGLKGIYNKVKNKLRKK